MRTLTGTVAAAAIHGADPASKLDVTLFAGWRGVCVCRDRRPDRQLRLGYQSQLNRGKHASLGLKRNEEYGHPGQQQLSLSICL